NVGNDAAQLRALKFLTLSAFMQRGLEIDQLRKKPWHKLPEIPDGLREMLGKKSIGAFEEKIANASLLTHEPSLRFNLIAQFPDYPKIPDAELEPAPKRNASAVKDTQATLPKNSEEAKKQAEQAEEDLQISPEQKAAVDVQWKADIEKGMA